MRKWSSALILSMCILFVTFFSSALNVEAGDVNSEMVDGLEVTVGENEKIEDGDNIFVDEMRAESGYNANKAAEYALKHWNNYNSAYANFNPYGGDCANFVSQCLYAGGLPMTNGWYYYSSNNRSGSWTGCTSMMSYFTNQGYTTILKPSASQVAVGDVILYQFEGGDPGIYQHAAIITEIINGQPWICAHNEDLHTSDWTLRAKTWTVIKMNGTTSYEPEGRLDSVTSEKGTITIHGWAFDRDDLSANLYLHVYVGGPAGSGAPFYVVQANKYRNDVNEVFPGVGEYHGYYDTIKVGARGETDIYVYAINNEPNQTNPLIGMQTVNITNEYSIDFEKDEVSLFSHENQEIGFSFTGDGVCHINCVADNVINCFPSLTAVDWENGTGRILLKSGLSGSTNITVALQNEEFETLYEKSFQVTIDVQTGEIVITPNVVQLDVEYKQEGTVLVDASDCVGGSERSLAFSYRGESAEAYYTWISETLAEVTIYARKPGETEICCTLFDESLNILGYEEFQVIVEQRVTNISLNTSNIDLKKSDTYKLTASILPTTATNKEIKWTSSDTNVATVDANGKVTAVAAGTCSLYGNP